MVGKSRRNISDLMDIRPDYANVEQGGQLVQVDPDEVTIGTVPVVQPGRRFPSTGGGGGNLHPGPPPSRGEPSPGRPAWEEIISGCINLTGLLKVRTTRELGVHRVQDPGPGGERLPRKSRSEAFITRFARVYTPVMCIAALALALLPPLVRMSPGPGASLGDWIYRALTFLVISCPCALVISIPLSFFA